ncbi:toast rack family protein [Candidatus Zixiibacteriota bacterium]
MSPGKLRTGVFLILTGSILLLNTTGALDWSYWVDLIWLWPVLLIAIGVEKLFLATKVKQLAYISSLILILTVVWAWTSHARSTRVEEEPVFTADADYSKSFPMDSSFNSLVTDIDFGAGKLFIGSSADMLFDGDFYKTEDRPRVTMNRRRSRAVINVRSDDFRHIRWPSRIGNRWKIDLSNQLPVRLNIDCGAAGLRLDLADVQLERLDLNCGASEIDLIIGKKSPRVDAYIDCGASHLDIKIPQGAGLRVRRDIPVSSFRSPGIKLQQRGSYYETAGFADAPVRVNLDLEAGVSVFRVSYSDETVEPGSI